MSYPDEIITGPYRIPLLLINIILVIISFNITVIYFKHYHEHKETFRGTLMHVAWGVLFIGFGMMDAVYTFADFYSAGPNERLFILEFGYLAGSLGCFVFIFLMEQLKIFYNRRIFTSILGIALIILIFLIVISFFIPVNRTVQSFSYVFWAPMIGFVFWYFFQIAKLVRGKLRMYTMIMIAGSIILILGALGTTDIMVRTFGIIFSILGGICQIAGSILITASSLQLPSWRELEWRQSLFSIITLKNGMLLFEYDFKPHEKRISSSVVAGFISTSTDLLKVIPSGEVKIFDLEDKKILIEQDKDVIFALIAETHLKSLEYLLHRARVEFESFFKDVIDNWDGDVDTFKPARYIIEKVFS